LFYLWSTDEFADATREALQSQITSPFKISPEGNYFDQATARKTGLNILHLHSMRTSDGKLLHSCCGTASNIPAYSTDYAFFIWGLIELYEATFEETYLAEAISLTETLLEDFWMTDAGGLYLTASDSEELLIRSRVDIDGTLPSANSVAALNLLRVGRMTQNHEYEKRGIDIIESVSSMVARYPLGLAFLLTAADFYAGPTVEVVIA
jgi:uncharacterized protein